MLKTDIKTAWRNIKKNAFYSLLNILGLSIGMAIALFLYIYTDFHNSFDNYHVQAENTFKVVHELHLGNIEHNPGSSYAMFSALESEIPEIEQTAFLISNQKFTLDVDNKPINIDAQGAITSSEWFDIFDYRWLYGDADALDDANNIVLTTKLSKILFEKNDPIDKTVVINGKFPFKVVGLIDNHNTNTNLNADFYISFSSLKSLRPDLTEDFFVYWGDFNRTSNTFITLKNPNQREIVEQKIMNLVQQHLEPDIAKVYKFNLLPLREIHLDARYGGTTSHRLLTLLNVIGICIVVISGINYINISIAQQASRSLEIGTRKVLGGTRWQLFRQFMIESIIISLIGLVIACILLPMLISLGNNHIITSEPIQLVTFGKIWLFAIGLFCVVTLGTGGYPAYLLGQLTVSDALKGKLSFGKRFGRHYLLVLQNIVAQVLIIVTIVVVFQTKFLRSTDIGFNRESIGIINIPDNAHYAQQKVIARYLDKNPRIIDYSFCFQAPASDRGWGGTVLFDNRPDWEAWTASYVYADTSYLTTFEIELVAGRNLREQTALPEYLINESMVSILGHEQPLDIVGKPLIAGGLHDEQGIIVGVVKDFNVNSLLDPIKPVVIGSKPEMYSSLVVRLTPNASTSTLLELQETWAQLFPNAIFDFRFLDTQIDSLYRKEIQQQRLIWIASIVSVLISSLGLLGMISLIALFKTKEIGIRKVFGASANNIVFLLSWGFLKVIALAFLLSVPIAWWITNSWLDDFAYRISLNWLMFVSGGIISAVISFLTVGFKVVQASITNPAKTLRNE